VSDGNKTKGLIMPRSIKDIASDIRAHWRPVHGSAEEYVCAMEKLDKVTDRYGADTAVTVLAYFQGAAATWKGADAQRIKDEIKSLLKGA
jgi:hypothetical protein